MNAMRGDTGLRSSNSSARVVSALFGHFPSRHRQYAKGRTAPSGRFELNCLTPAREREPEQRQLSTRFLLGVLCKAPSARAEVEMVSPGCTCHAD